MTWNEYLPLAEKTLSKEFYANKKEEFLLHSVMGIITELEELIDSKDVVNMGEEIADIFWYISIIDRELSINLKIENNDNDEQYNILALYKVSSLLMDHLKKKIFYNKEIDTDNFKQLTLDLFNKLCNFCKTNNIDIESILESNIDKLKARYGEKFTSERAINRDLETEREILEEGYKKS